MSNFIEITLRHGCSLVNLLQNFRTPFSRVIKLLLPKMRYVIISKEIPSNTCRLNLKAFQKLNFNKRKKPKQVRVIIRIAAVLIFFRQH